MSDQDGRILVLLVSNSQDKDQEDMEYGAGQAGIPVIKLCGEAAGLQKTVPQ